MSRVACFCFPVVLVCSLVCVCVCGWVSRCDQSATVDNWETQVSDVVDVHRVFVTLLIVVVVVVVTDESR